MIARYRGGAIAARAGDDRRSRRCSNHSARRRRRLDAYDITGALERIWEVVRALNRHVEATAPWQLAKDERARRARQVLYDLADGLRAVAVALPRTARASSGSSRRSVSRRTSTGTPWRYGRTAASRGSSRPSPSSRGSTQPATRRDRHARASRRVRGAGSDPRARARRGRRPGRHDRDRNRVVPAALALAEAHEGVVAALGIDPHRRRPQRRVGSTSCARCSSTRRPVAVGETGLDDFHHCATLAEQRALPGAA